MEIEIYKKGENIPYIINNWNTYFKLFGNPWKLTCQKFTQTFEFWNPIEKRTLDTEMVFGHLLRLWRMNEDIELMVTKEL